MYHYSLFVASVNFHATLIDFALKKGLKLYSLIMIKIDKNIDN